MKPPFIVRNECREKGSWGMSGKLVMVHCLINHHPYLYLFLSLQKVIMCRAMDNTFSCKIRAVLFSFLHVKNKINAEIRELYSRGLQPKWK
jgi:hypothetical protein